MNIIYSFKKMVQRFLIKSIFKIHPLVYFFTILSFLIGYYKEFIIVSFLIIVHELGHFLCAKSFGVKTKQIYIYPLGGVSQFYMNINTSFCKEFLILIMGPMFQNIAYFILCFFFPNSLVYHYHVGILFFNLLPIYPLDGGKILNLFVNYFFPFKKSLQISILISYVVTVLILFLHQEFSINMILNYLLFLMIIRKEERRIPLYYHKFLLERLFHSFSFRRSIIISKEESFYRYRRNIVQKDNSFLDEVDYLKNKYFSKNY
ncbi:MAG: site-2 protease family protein [Bacilli bacterium]|nr:site-2 protease family protein [Bacilli bacterium]